MPCRSPRTCAISVTTGNPGGPVARLIMRHWWRTVSPIALPLALAIVGGCVGGVVYEVAYELAKFQYAPAWLVGVPGQEVPLPHHVPKYPGNVTLRFAMVH